MAHGFFMLSASPAERLRLKAFTSSSTGTKTTIRIVLESDDLLDAGYALRCLAAVQEEQKAQAKAAAAAKRKHPKQLALPPPDGL